MRRAGRILCLSALILASPDAEAQSIPPKNTISVPSTVSAAQLDDFYRQKRDLLRTRLPRLVFIPGILGSQIDECQPDGTQCSPVWGTIGALTDSGINLSIRSDRSYRTDVIDRILFADFYGNFLDTLRQRVNRLTTDTPEDPLIHVFDYDWRRSNVDNANLLAKEICDIAATAPDSPIVAVGHSMGGLILKLWARRYGTAPCSDGGSSPNIDQLVFVATPHLGSPKALKAFTDGYAFIFDDVERYGKQLYFFETNYLLRSLNSAGVGFKSIYELLPIASSESCRNLKPELEQLAKELNGGDSHFVNAFDLDTWVTRDLLRRFDSTGLRTSFYANTLPKLLREAETMLCDLVDYDPSAVANVTYLIGRETDDHTFVSVSLTSKGNSSELVFLEGSGDGTVPTYSAENRIVSRSMQVLEDSSSHVVVANSPKLWALINGWYAAAEAGALTELADRAPHFETVVVQEAAATGRLLSIPLDARLWETEQVSRAAQLNAQAISAMGYAPADIAELASSTFDPQGRGELFALAATSTVDQTERLTWTAEVGRSAYVGGFYDIAVANSDSVLTVDSAADTMAASIAKEVKGWSQFRSGDLSGNDNIIQDLIAGKLVEPRFKFPNYFNFPNNAEVYFAINPSDSNYLPYHQRLLDYRTGEIRG